MRRIVTIILLLGCIFMSACANQPSLPNTDESAIGNSNEESSPLPDNSTPENSDTFLIDISDIENIIITSYWDDSVVDNLSKDDTQLLIDLFQGKELSSLIPSCDNDIKIEAKNCTLLIQTECGSVTYMINDKTGATELSDSELKSLLEILHKYDIGTEA